jgi:tRNA threonylcarbamoyladenosine biosynthesis protein TsaE
MNASSNHKLSSSSEQQTKDIAKSFAKKCKSPCVILLEGDLGSGKTSFVRGLAEGLGIFDTIASPSYTYLRTYGVPKSNATLYHFDLYLLSEKKGDSSSLFLDEALSDPNGIVVIEWANYLPVSRKIVAHVFRIQILNDNERLIVYKSLDDTGL